MRKRWKNWVAGAVVAFGTISGCKQPLYMTTNDHQEMMKLGLPENFEYDPTASQTIPPSEGHLAPPDVLNPDRPVRYMSLAEAFAIALEMGNEGGQGLTGQSNSLLGSAVGGQFGGDDAIRAFALDPASVGANIEASASKFDVRWISRLSWGKRDDANANNIANLQNGDNAQFSSALFKPLPTGGLAGVTFATDYNRLSSVPIGGGINVAVNPSYRPSLTFSFEQPLLQGFGTDINQLLAQHPGSISQNIRPSGGARAEGLLITRIRYDISKVDFERRVNNMILNVERAYWNLYSAYFSLYASEQGLRQAYVTYQLTRLKQEAGAVAVQDTAQVEAQFEEFRVRRLQSLQQVLDAERNLRGLLALPVEDGKRIVPADAPTLAAYKPDWNSAVGEMLANRPELQAARLDLRARQLDLILQKNGLRPDLRFTTNYNINGIGTRLDGNEDVPQLGNALSSLTHNRFNTWNIGFVLDVPIGTRDAHANVRISRLNLARSYVVLKNQERKAEQFLQENYQNVIFNYEQIRNQRSRRIALSKQLEALATLVKLGKQTLIVLLDAQRNYADALAQEYAAIANYNSAIAAFQYAKGTVLQYNNINIAEGSLPDCVLERAQQHFESRTNSLIARTRETLPDPHSTGLPGLLEHQPKTPEMPEELRHLPNTGASATPLDPLSKPQMSLPSQMPSGSNQMLPLPSPAPSVPMPSNISNNSSPKKTMLSGSAGATLPPEMPIPPNRPLDIPVSNPRP